MNKHKELKALIKGASKADRVGAHEYFVNRFGADSVGPVEEYLPRPAGYWTLERIHTEALKYDTRKEFEKGSRGAHKAARRLKIMEQVCVHMNPVRQYHTAESIAEEALKYETRYVFQKGSPGAHDAARRLKIMEQVCAHMPKHAGREHKK